MNSVEIAKIIDHTLLKAAAGEKDIEKLCREAVEYGFASVCVNPVWVKKAVAFIEAFSNEAGKRKPAVCTVIGFPLGASAAAVKRFESTTAIEDGADELDMVMNIGAAKDGNWDAVYDDIKGVVDAAKKASRKVIVKVILENCYLTKAEIEKACNVCVDAGADFVKTSTGFGTSGADAEDVALMRRTVGNRASVKAAGGIRTKEDALAMINAGADRIGCSAGIAIIGE